MHTLSPGPNPSPHASRSARKSRARISCLALALLALGLRTHQLAQKSLWLDEAFSVWMSEQPLPDLLSWTVQIDQHPPLYYLLLRAWTQVGSALASPYARAFWIRLPSALFGTLTIPIVYALGRRLFGSQAGLLAALLLALSPFHVWFGQEARMYALLTLNASLAMLGLVRWLTSPPPQPSPVQPTGEGEEMHTRRKAGTLTLPPVGCTGESARWRARDLFRPPVGCTGESARWRARDLFRPPVGCTGESAHWRVHDHFLPPVGRTGGTEGGRGWSLYILFTAATLWTHNTALFFWVATNLFVLASLGLRRRETGFLAPKPSFSSPTTKKPGFRGRNPVSISLRPWLLSQLAILLLWSPWFVPFLRQAAGVDREFWLPAPTWATLAGALNAFLSAFLPQQIAWQSLAWLAAGALLCGGICALRSMPGRLTLLIVLFVTPIAGELLVSLRRPVFYTRTLIWATIPFYLLLAIGGTQALPARPGKARRRAIKIATLLALAVLVAANARSLQRYYTNYQEEAWDQAAAHVAQHLQPGDLILFNATWVQLPFDFYFDPPVHAVEHGLPVDLFDRDTLEPKMTEQDLPYLEGLIQGHSQVWLIYSHNWYTDPQGLIPKALAQHHRLADRKHFPGIEVHRYRRQ